MGADCSFKQKKTGDPIQLGDLEPGERCGGRSSVWIRWSSPIARTLKEADIRLDVIAKGGILAKSILFDRRRFPGFFRDLHLTEFQDSFPLSYGAMLNVDLFSEMVFW